MGCYDTWCPLCGGPLNGVYNDDLAKYILNLIMVVEFLT